jgi:hypothetical protein
MEQASGDRVRWFVTNHAEECVENLQETGETPRPEAALRTEGRWTVLVAAFPTPSDQGVPLGLTECDHNCLALLAQARQPLSGARVRKELEIRNVGIYGLITVKRSLAKLKRMGLVLNSRRAARGYYLPETLPLVQHAARQ